MTKKIPKGVKSQPTFFKKTSEVCCVAAFLKGEIERKA